MVDTQKINDYYNYPMLYVPKEKNTSYEVHIFDNRGDKIKGKSNKENILEDEFWDDVKQEEDTMITSSKTRTIFNSSLYKTVDFDDLLNKGKGIDNQLKFLETAPNNERASLGPSLQVIKKKEEDHKEGHNYSSIQCSLNNSGDKILADSNFKIRKKMLNQISTKHKPNGKYFYITSKIKQKCMRDKNTQQRNLSSESNQKELNITFRSSVDQTNTSVNQVFSTRRNNNVNKQQNLSMDETPSEHKVKAKMRNLHPSVEKLEKLNMMHNKWKEMNEKRKRMQNEKNEKEKKKEIEICTFKPQINNQFVSKKDTQPNERNSLTIYQRHIFWREQNMKKIEMEKHRYKVSEKRECTFSPEVTKVIPTYKTSICDKMTMKYYERVTKAKQVKEEINMKLNPNYNKIYDRLKKNQISLKKENDVNIDEYLTFNPNKVNLSYENALKQLHLNLNNETESN